MQPAQSELEAAPSPRWLVAILLLSLCINISGIGWGLPNGNSTWAADSFQPMAPMAVAKHGLWGERWNSGWFYFKYPIGHPLALLAAELPYLGWLRLTGQLHTPKSDYPYGFTHPERALMILAVLTRLVSALMGVGAVALAYLLTAQLFGRTAGLVSAVLVTGCYPIVFYAHTSNVDVPLLFWIALAVTAGVMAADRDRLAAAALSGAAMAMGLLTKEPSLGASVAVPVIWILRRWWGRGVTWRDAARHAVGAGAAFTAVTVLVGNVWWNPSGYINRWRFLLGILPASVRDQYAPYQFQVQVPKGFSIATEMTRLLKTTDTVAHALTLPVLLLCVAGFAWALWRRPRGAVIPLVVITTYYVFAVRATALMQVRYTMPLLYFLLPFGGVAGAQAVYAARTLAARAGRQLTYATLVVGLVLAVLPGIDIVRLLAHDPRYAAESWLRTRSGSTPRVEIYERPTYLPRFSAEMQVTQVPVEERTVESFQRRQPDLVIISSGGHAGLTGRYVRDWHPGMPIIADIDAAKVFFERLRSEQLGYRRVERFRTPTWWITPRINSLNPEITIFAPDAQPSAVHG